MRWLYRWNLVALLVTLALSSCSKTGNTTPEEVLKLSSAEVTALLGLKNRAGLKVGDVESGREGIKVKSISISDSGNTEVEISDIELRITSPSKLVYALSTLKVGKLDVLDWKTTQRVQAMGIQVDKPATGFLTKLENTIASIRAGNSFKTTELSCDKLSINRIEYVLRTVKREDPSKQEEPVVTKVSIADFTISDATSTTLGTLSVSSASVGDMVSGKGLKLTKVDRVWADELLASLVNSPATDKPSPRVPVTSSEPMYPSKEGRKPTPTPTKSADVRMPIPATNVLSKKILPFDIMEMGEFNIITPFGNIVIDQVKLTTTRGSNGKLMGCEGSGRVTVPHRVVTEDRAGNDEYLQFFRAMGDPQVELAIICQVKLNMKLDASGQNEETTIIGQAPGLVTVTLSATTRHFYEMLSRLLAHPNQLSEEYLRPDECYIQNFTVEGVDQGLGKYLLSERHKNRDAFIKFLRELAENWSKDEKVNEQIHADLDRFLKSPRRVTLRVESPAFQKFNKFMRASSKNPNNDPILMKLTFSDK